LIEANSCGWLINLAALSGRFGDADTVYPGHGDPGPAAQQISEQRDYLKHYRELVRPAVAPGSDAGPTVTDRESQYIVGELDRAYPNYPRVASLPNLQELNVAAVGRELVTEAPPPCRLNVTDMYAQIHVWAEMCEWIAPKRRSRCAVARRNRSVE
jgi:hypothetical protein